MTYFYYRDDGRVACYSETPIETKLKEIQLTTNIDLTKNPTLYVKSGILEAEQNPLATREENKELIKNAKTIDELKDLIIKLL